MPAIVIGPGDLGSCVLIPHREREIACLCKCQTRRIIEQLRVMLPSANDVFRSGMPTIGTTDPGNFILMPQAMAEVHYF